MAKRHRHPEYHAAERALLAELDLADRVMIPIRGLVECSLGRIFWHEWLRSDAKNSKWVATPGDHDEPELHRIDGWPEYGAGTVERKWSRRARLWMSWYSIDAWHVCDWLVNAVSDGESWVSNQDINGCPKKLMKCGSLKQLTQEATKGLRQRNAQAAHDIVLGPNDEHFVSDLGGGHTLVRLCSSLALRREGSIMHHCIGHGGYDLHLDDPDVLLVSVRNTDGHPLATLEIQSGFIRQFRGVANSEPSTAVKDLVAGAIHQFGWQHWRDRKEDDPDRRVEAAAALHKLPPARRRG